MELFVLFFDHWVCASDFSVAVPLEDPLVVPYGMVIRPGQLMLINQQRFTIITFTTIKHFDH
jgi:hypothetical protein